MTSVTSVGITSSHMTGAVCGEPSASGMRTEIGTYVDTDTAVDAASSPRCTSTVHGLCRE